MKYISTRGNHSPVECAQAIKWGMVPRGGLFVPESVPALELGGLKELSYQQLSEKVLSLFLSDYSEEEINSFVSAAYNSERFDDPAIAPIHYLSDTVAILELWHGPTAAFKDLALQIMPHFLSAATQKLESENETVILVATSGDTGKAALEGFKDVPGTRIIVFYPEGGVSQVQELQMLSTGGKNTHVVPVKGNFDDCQNMVKDLFGDIYFSRELLQAGYEFSSANSINWGRLVPQIIYYFWAYFDMLREKKILIGDSINIVVPTGNFGNILAGYYARQMGLPVQQFICASNVNKVLTDFIESGNYDRKRDFYRTMSPSMDILISSNLERFLFEINGHKAENLIRWYDELRTKGSFRVDETTRQRIAKIFTGGFATEQQTLNAIKSAYEEHGYLIDTHTAVAYHVYQDYFANTGDQTPTIIDSTASPYKFNRAVYTALTGNDSEESDEFEIMERLREMTGVPVHRAVTGLKENASYRPRAIRKSSAREAIRGILGIEESQH